MGGTVAGRRSGPTFMLRVALIGAIGCLPGYALAQQGWTTFSPPDKSFTIALPAPPSATTDNSVDDGVPYTQDMYIAKVPGFLALASIARYQHGPRKPSAQTVLDALLQGLKAHLISSQEHSFKRGKKDVVPGLEFALENDQETCKGDIYVDQFNVLAAAACSAKGVDKAADFERVLGSFKLGKSAR